MRTTQIDILFKKDLRQNQSFNPFSPESNQMIRDVGNIELCELLETEPKTQCTVCLSYWNIGTLHYTCGHFLHKERGANQQFINYTMDFLSVPEYVIKKGRLHGHRCGKKPGDKEYHTANQLKKRCKKKYFQGIHDRFIRDQEFRIRMVEHHRDEEVCRRWDALADEDHTHHLTPQEYSLSVRVTGGFIRTSKVPILCQWSTDLTSNRHCLTLQQLKQKAEGASQMPTYSHKCP